MSVGVSVEELLLAWEEATERGQSVTAEDLCASRPELLGPLRRAIQALRDFEPALADPPTAPADPPLPGRANRSFPVAGYEPLGELGRGGMGVVFKARQAGLNRLVAVKMVLSGSMALPDQVARFRAEAELLGQLRHPNIVTVHEVGESDGQPYFVLEYIDGGSLADWLARALPSAQEAARLVATLAGAVEAAHRQGVVHRDLKPGNVLLAGEGPTAVPLGGVAREPKVSDFGLAKRLDASAGLTAPEAVLGTPSYMAPEQASRALGDVGPAADVYALGAILYECLTGKPPFRAASQAETILQLLYEEPVPPRRLQPRIPRDLETVCLKCLSKAPAMRYGSAQGVADDLRRFLAGEPIRARPIGPGRRTAKWVRRQPVVAALLVTVALVAAVGGGLVTWKWREAKRQQGQAERNLDKLVKLFGAFRQSFDAFDGYVSSDVAWRPENQAKVRQWILGSTVYVEQALIEVTGDGPDTVERRAVAFDRLLSVAANQLTAKEALTVNDNAATRYKELAQKYPDRPTFPRLLARTAARRGLLHEKKAELAQAEASYRDALRQREALAERWPDDPDCALDLAVAHNQLACVLHDDRRPADALASFGRAVSLLEALCKGHGRLADQDELLAVLQLRAAALTLGGRHWEAAADLDQAVALDRDGKAVALRLTRAKAHARAGDHARAACEARQLAVSPYPSGQIPRLAAGTLALAAVAAAGDAELSEAYAADAVALLSRARAAGSFATRAEVEALTADPDLASLKGRADFRKLLTELAR